jgi:hypothetical protein
MTSKAEYIEEARTMIVCARSMRLLGLRVDMLHCMEAAAKAREKAIYGPSYIVRGRSIDGTVYVWAEDGEPRIYTFEKSEASKLKKEEAEKVIEYIRERNSKCYIDNIIGHLEAIEV